MNIHTESPHARTLKQHGFRITEGRIKLLSFLQNIASPVTAHTIQDHGNLNIDKVTLYRALHDFAEKGLVREVTFPGMATHYELAHGTHHHHHIICTMCNTIEDVHVQETALLREVRGVSSRFFAITSHTLEFLGICTSCAAQHNNTSLCKK